MTGILQAMNSVLRTELFRDSRHYFDLYSISTEFSDTTSFPRVSRVRIPGPPDVHRLGALRRHRRGDPVRLRGARPAARPMSDEALLRENSYLKARIAQLQSDVADLSAEVDRLRQERERLHGRREARAPNPLGSGQ